ncbi:hypothetical protein CAMGR0001_1089 [Campylobacter gracilis RM3268]|uniref:Uncharacterized protein n=1 Tax=Campylobacter gracilis RM3268 TaxID=553220 RepID=C8PGU5_9BACT|nr:hypothetical protein CAMGR0001_1089 [Campylobacter gracilis RM3268]
MPTCRIFRNKILKFAWIVMLFCVIEFCGILKLFFADFYDFA